MMTPTMAVVGTTSRSDWSGSSKVLSSSPPRFEPDVLRRVLSLATALAAVLLGLRCGAERDIGAVSSPSPVTSGSFGAEDGGNRRPGHSPRSVAVSPSAIPPSDAVRRVVGDAGGTKQTESSSPSVSDHDPLRSFRDQLTALKEGRRAEMLRILWLGDSHTAADYMTHALRRALARQIPLGGPGYVALGVPHYRHGMAQVASEGDFEVAPHPPARRDREDDGVFGLGGMRAAGHAGAGVSARLSERRLDTPTTCTLTYRAHGADSALSFAVGASRLSRRSGCQSSLPEGLCQVTIAGTSSDPCAVRIDGGTVQLFGMVMETTEPGLVIDTLGINGARFQTPLAWHEEAWRALVAQRHPSLGVVAYGTNEVFDDERVERHMDRLRSLVARLRRVGSDMECLVVGPTDIGRGGPKKAARVALLDESQEATARELGCAYMSPYRVIHEEGGFAAWQAMTPPRSLSDGIHLTVAGYTVLGERIAELLLGRAGMGGGGTGGGSGGRT